MLDLFPQTPYLNPFEDLCNYLKMRLASYGHVPTSMHQLWERIEVEWDKIPVEECLKLIETMPDRISAVIKAKGRHTKY